MDSVNSKRHQRKGKPISASEIGRFLYCERSWWYSLQGEESSQHEALAQGARQHEVFAGEVRVIERAQVRARALIWILAIAIVLLAFGLATGLL